MLINAHAVMLMWVYSLCKEKCRTLSQLTSIPSGPFTISVSIGLISGHQHLHHGHCHL